MKNIVVLVDFTRVCEPAIAQAGTVARKTNGRLILLHIAPEEHQPKLDDLLAELKIFAEVLGSKPINLELKVEFGDFMTLIGSILQALNADLVVVGTHGMRGRQRNLFSRNIAALLQELNLPTLVVQGQRSQAPDELDAWMISGERMNDGIGAVEWLRSAFEAKTRYSVNAREPEEIETEAFDNDCSLIIWQGEPDTGMDLILNHFGIPVLLL